MAKVAVLLPDGSLQAEAERIAGAYTGMDVFDIECVQTEAISRKLDELRRKGCELVIARGLQALLVKRYSDFPVVTISASIQELGLLAIEIKKALSMDCPRVGLIGFDEIQESVSCFRELFGVDLACYTPAFAEEDSITAALRRLVEQARADGCVGVIGGRTVCAKAKELALAYRFQSVGAPELKNAFHSAQHISYAIDLEKKNSAEMNAMLDFMFCGAMQIDQTGVIHRTNRTLCDVIEKRPEELLKRNILEVFPQLDAQILEQTLYEGRQTCTVLTAGDGKTLAIDLTPVILEADIQGAILTVQESERITQIDRAMRRELYQRGFVAEYGFQNWNAENAQTKKTIMLARRIARYPAPVLLTGESGTGKELLAQCIHNASPSAKNAFISIDCGAYLPETLDTMLFGNYTTRKDTPRCMAELAQNGTIYLSHVAALSTELQFKLLALIRGSFWHNGAVQPVAACMRILASNTSDLIADVERGSFRVDLYYALNAVKLELLPLRRRREDIMPWVRQYLKQWQQQYQRRLTLTHGAETLLIEYDWPGNMDQLQTVCQRIVLLSERQSVDEAFLRRQLEQSAPHFSEKLDTIVVYKDREAEKIAELLKQYAGNRQRVADKLNISKSTLWRRIKKYGIAPDYSY